MKLEKTDVMCFQTRLFEAHTNLLVPLQSRWVDFLTHNKIKKSVIKLFMGSISSRLGQDTPWIWHILLSLGWTVSPEKRNWWDILWSCGIIIV